MTTVEEDTDWMPVTLRVAFTILSAITALSAIPLLLFVPSSRGYFATPPRPWRAVPRGMPFSFDR